MSKLIIALTTATVASAGASTYFWQELREERAQTATLQTRIAQLEQVSEPTAPPSAPVESAAAEAPVETAAPTPAAAGTKAQPTARAGLAVSGAFGAASLARPVPDPEMRRRMLEAHEQQLRMLQDPEYRELMRSQHKLSMQQHYSDLEALLGLSKEQSEQLLDTLSEQAIRSMEQRPMLAEMDGTPPSEAEMREQRRILEEQHRRNESEIAAVLGSKYGDWQQYQQNGWARSQVTRLRQALAVTDEPLRQDQIKPLVEAIAREQKQMMSARMTAPSRHDPLAQARMAEEWLERTAQSHQRIRSAVSGLLTPTQYEQLERQQQQELKMQELSVKQQRARAEAQARGELPPDPVPGMFNSAVTYTQ